MCHKYGDKFVLNAILQVIIEMDIFLSWLNSSGKYDQKSISWNKNKSINRSVRPSAQWTCPFAAYYFLNGKSIRIRTHTHIKTDNRGSIEIKWKEDKRKTRSNTPRRYSLTLKLTSIHVYKERKRFNNKSSMALIYINPNFNAHM